MSVNEVEVEQRVESLNIKDDKPTNGQEEGHDSGVDESTQSREVVTERPPTKVIAHPTRRRQAKSTEPPLKRTPMSTQSVERKLSMNKIEVGKSASPNIQAAKSKVGAINPNYKPGGGNVKLHSQKLDFSKTSSRVGALNENYAPKGGDKKVETQKLNWKATSKVGSLDNKTHKPKGGDKKIESQKLNFKQSASSRVGSKDNITHKAGGGDVMISTEKLKFKESASSRVGSLNNVKHKAGGGAKKIFDDKEYLRQVSNGTSGASKPSSGRTSGAISPATTGTNSPGPQEEEQVLPDESSDPLK